MAPTCIKAFGYNYIVVYLCDQFMLMSGLNTAPLVKGCLPAHGITHWDSNSSGEHPSRFKHGIFIVSVRHLHGLECIF